MKNLLFLLLLLAQDTKKVVTLGPYLQQATPDSVIVCFQTADAVKAVVECDGRKFEGPEGLKHAIEIKGLKPGTRYEYRALGASGSFVTAPDGDKPFTFVAYGDNRSGHKQHEQIVGHMIKAQPAFLVNSGDLVENGTKMDQWLKFFEIATPLLKNVPLYPSLGNHERSSGEYFDFFVLPNNERWYSFDYGAAHFAILDMNGSYRKDEKQIAWLKEDLEKTKQPVKFVVYHQPAFSASASKNRLKDAEEIYATWGPIFEKHKVTATIQGHNHNYQRAEKNGVVYITTGGGGAGLYPIGTQPPEVKFARSIHHFIKITVAPKETVFQVIDLNGGEVEAFKIPR